MSEAIQLMFTLDQDRGLEERASFNLPEDGCYSQDRQALLVRALRVSGGVVRAVAKGSSLHHELRNLRALRCGRHQHDWEDGAFTFCWGDVEVFETGRPVVRSAVLLRDVAELPDLTQVMAYVAELKSIWKRV